MGDGRKIRIFEDAWLREKKDFRVETSSCDHITGGKICDLFIPGERRWDAQKVFNLFQNCDVRAILATPIPRN